MELALAFHMTPAAVLELEPALFATMAAVLEERGR